ncbi:MAG: hypothetical protein ABFS09_07160 [Thermodesulfobacteriota bacterium]
MQEAHNKKHGITPTTISSASKDVMGRCMKWRQPPLPRPLPQFGGRHP